MREIAEAAEVATGAAYYYFDSKDAIVMAFYDRATQEMRVDLEARLAKAKTLEARIRAIIEEKFEYFAPNRKLLGALASHTDPDHPLSPFSKETAHIRDVDLAFFDAACRGTGLNIPKDVAPYLPRLLWMYQMGLILFWVYDKSDGQQRTQTLFNQTLKMILLGLKLGLLPIFRPIHKIAAELLHVLYED